MAAKALLVTAVLIAASGIAIVFLVPNIQEKYLFAQNSAIGAYKSITFFFSHLICSQPAKTVTAQGVFTAEELKKYDGTSDSLGLYLAILGKVFNVEKGAQHYRPGGGYAFFAGRDASRAYITGDFTEEGLTDDLTGLSETSLQGVQQWVEFYEKDYEYIGKLAGRYYTNEGHPTEELKKIEAILQKVNEKDTKEDELRRLFPPCNSEWNKDTGGRVYCSTGSGGIQRSWSGVPRKFYSFGSSEFRCACVRTTGAPSTSSSGQHNNRGDLDDPRLKEYPNCAPLSDSCHLG